MFTLNKLSSLIILTICSFITFFSLVSCSSSLPIAPLTPTPKQSSEIVDGNYFKIIKNPYDFKEADSTKVLFIGNSHTFKNSVPDSFARIAYQCLRKKVWFNTSLSGGKTIQWHLQKGRALEKLNSRKWDFVSVQPQSVDSLFQYVRFKKSVGEFEERILANGAVPILYMTWSRDPNSETYIHEYEKLGIKSSFDAMQSLISKNFYAVKNNYLISAVGEKWQKVLKRYPSIELFSKDGNHAAPNGSYISALSLVDTVFPGNTKKLRHCSYIPLGVANEDSKKIRETIFN